MCVPAVPAALGEGPVGLYFVLLLQAERAKECISSLRWRALVDRVAAARRVGRARTAPAASACRPRCAMSGAGGSGLHPTSRAAVGPIAVTRAQAALQASHASVGVWALCSVAFFWVSGGVYGNETLLQAAPPLYVFVGLLTVPLLYSLPIALITAELSTAMPEDGGFVVWVSRACGPALGAHNAYWVWVIWLVDSSVYPVLASHFVAKEFELSRSAQALVADFVVVAITFVKLIGTKAIVRMSGVISTVAFVPTVLYMLLGLGRLKLGRATVASGEADWPLLLSWMLWLYSGFFSLGSLAGQVREPQTTYQRVTAVLIPVVTVLNVVPLLVSLSLDDERTHYTPGHFNTLAGVLGGVWLQKAFFVASILCQVGLYTGQSLTSERALAHLVESAAGRVGVIDSVMGRLPDSLLAENPDAGIAPVYVLANAALAGVLAWVPVTSLVQSEMLLMSCTGMLFLYSYVHLRRHEPDMVRPFKLTTTTPGAVRWVAAPMAITVTNLLVQLLGPGNRTHVPAFVTVMALGLLVHGAFAWDQRRRFTRRSLFRHMRKENLEDLEDARPLFSDDERQRAGIASKLGKKQGKRRSSDTAGVLKLSSLDDGFAMESEAEPHGGDSSLGERNGHRRAGATAAPAFSIE